MAVNKISLTAPCGLMDTRLRTLALESLKMAELDEQEAGVRWPPACEDVSAEAEEYILLENITQE